MTDTTVQAPGAAPIPGDVTADKRARRSRFRPKGSVVVMTLYLLFLLLPIYWLINMSLKTNAEILGSFSLYPRDLTLANYAKILTDPSWYMGYVNSLIYVVLNTVISLAVALPAAYAFSRYSFMGDKHLFFWLLTHRMAPPAVFALPFFPLYSSVGLFDTHIAVPRALPSGAYKGRPLMSWMAWTMPTAIFFGVIALLLITFTILRSNFLRRPAPAFSGLKQPVVTVCSSRFSARPLSI